MWMWFITMIKRRGHWRRIGLGASLEKPNAGSYGNDPINWRASSSPSPGLDNTGNRAPFVVAGADLNLIATNAPTDVVLSGSAEG